MEVLERCPTVVADPDHPSPCDVLMDAQYWPKTVQRMRIDWLEIIFIVLFTIIVLMGLIWNSMTITVFGTMKRTVIFSSSSLMLLLTICICDTLVTFLVMPLTIVIMVSNRIFSETLSRAGGDVGTDYLCNIIGFIFNYASRMVLLCLSMASVDRFLAIFIPFKYKQTVTPLRIRILLLICHVICLLASVAPFIAGSTYYLDSNFAGCFYNFEDLVTPYCSLSTVNGTENGGGGIGSGTVSTTVTTITKVTVRCGHAPDKLCGDLYEGEWDLYEQCLSNSLNMKVSNPEVIGTSYFFIVFLIVIVPAVIMIVCSLSVIIRLKMRLREKNAHAPKRDKKKKKEENALLDKKNKKPMKDPQEQATETITYLVILYVICYFPWWFIGFETFLEYTGGLPYKTFVNNFGSPQVYHYLFLYLTLATYINSSVNPMIYFGRNKQLMDQLDSIIKYKAKLRLDMKRQISGPTLSIPTF